MLHSTIMSKLIVDGSFISQKILNKKKLVVSSSCNFIICQQFPYLVSQHGNYVAGAISVLEHETNMRLFYLLDRRSGKACVSLCMSAFTV